MELDAMQQIFLQVNATNEAMHILQGLQARGASIPIAMIALEAATVLAAFKHTDGSDESLEALILDIRELWMRAQRHVDGAGWPTDQMGNA